MDAKTKAVYVQRPRYNGEGTDAKLRQSMVEGLSTRLTLGEGIRECKAKVVHE